MSNLLEASERMYEWLLSPDAQMKQFDIPDDIWIPFSEVVQDARDGINKKLEVGVMPGIGIPLMTERCYECLKRRGGCQIAYGSSDCKKICDMMLKENNEH